MGCSASELSLDSLVVDPRAAAAIQRACSGTRPADERHMSGRNGRQRHAHADRGRSARSWSAAPASPASRPRWTWPRAASRSTWWTPRRPSAGSMAQLDKTFPTGDCAMCILSPKLVECARNKNIEIITLADVAGHLRRAGQLQGQAPPEPALRRPGQVQRLRRLHRGLPGRPAQRVRPRAWAPARRSSGPTRRPSPTSSASPRPTGRAPCKAACPAGVNAQGYVALIAAGKFKEAYELVRERCPLPGRLRARLPASLRGRVQPRRGRRAGGGPRPQAVRRRLRRRRTRTSTRRPSPRPPSWTPRWPSSAAARPA